MPNKPNMLLIKSIGLFVDVHERDSVQHNYSGVNLYEVNLEVRLNISV